jgi:hypothetical protein
MKISALKGIALAVAMSLASSVPSLAQVATQAPASAQAGCIAPPLARSGSVNWYLGFHPSDDLTTVWCRIQTLPGNVRFNLLFPTSGATKSWDTSFGRTILPAGQIVKLVQSVLPVDDNPMPSDNGKLFGDVLAQTVQLGADEAPDKTPLGFAPDHPARQQLVLWEPLVVRVKPVVLAGQPFTLTMVLKPNLGMLAMGMMKQATDVTVRGWGGRMASASFLSKSCPSEIPDCKGLPEVRTMHMPLLLDSLRLEAEGDNLTVAALQIGQQLVGGHRSLLKNDPMSSFDTSRGEMSFDIHDNESKVAFKAQGSAGGTTRIVIEYRALVDKNSLRGRLAAYADQYRIGSNPEKKKPLPVPDSLGRL